MPMSKVADIAASAVQGHTNGDAARTLVRVLAGSTSSASTIDSATLSSSTSTSSRLPSLVSSRTCHPPSNTTVAARTSARLATSAPSQKSPSASTLQPFRRRTASA